MLRLVRQIQEAAAQGKEILIVSAKSNGTRANANREKMLREITGVESINVISGFVNFTNFIESTVEECL